MAGGNKKVSQNTRTSSGDRFSWPPSRNSTASALVTNHTRLINNIAVPAPNRSHRLWIPQSRGFRKPPGSRHQRVSSAANPKVPTV